MALASQMNCFSSLSFVAIDLTAGYESYDVMLPPDEHRKTELASYLRSYLRKTPYA